MKSTKVSIIVPIYNVEAYLEDCIDSILAQSEKSYEIILVDDGSSDNSLAICFRYAKENSSIRVYHQSNMGVSAARNLGISKSLGENIMFVDSDDIVAPNIIKTLFDNLERTNSDVSITGVSPFTVHVDHSLKAPCSKSTILSSSQAIQMLFTQTGIRNGVYARLYKKSLFKNELFATGTSIGEDLEMSYRLLSKSSSISIVDCDLYYYRQRQDSAMYKSNTKEKLQVIDVARTIIDDIEARKPNLITAAHTMLFTQALFIMSTLDVYSLEVKKLMGEHKMTIKTSAEAIMTKPTVPIKLRLYASMFSLSPSSTNAFFFYKTKIANIIIYLTRIIKSLLSMIIKKYTKTIQGVLNRDSNINVLIMTLGPLGTNFGGIVQAIALSRVIYDLGYRVTVYDHVKNDRNIKVFIKKLVKKRLLSYTSKFGKIDNSLPIYASILATNTKLFIDNNIHRCTKHTIKYSRFSYDAIIVGSDQVWRKPYSNIPEYMLEFTKGMDIERISYAASFGKDDLSEYGDKLIKKSALLAKKFDAISVREDSGVDICNEYWGVKAQQHVDPTLLLEKDDYLKLIHEDINVLKKSDGQIFTYVLDSDKNKDEIIDKVSSHLKLKSFDIMPPKPMTKKELLSNPDKFALPHVTQWLKSFKDADFIITDSFHGSVFSIIFNKPFIAIGNKERGLTRFSSLLRLFKLEDRLVSNSNGALNIVDSKINWKEVNEIKLREKKRGIKYLKDNLQAVSQVRYDS